MPKMDEKRIVNRKQRKIEENYKIIKYYDCIGKNNENDFKQNMQIAFYA